MTADRKTLWKGRRGRFVWHVYRPTSPTKFGRVSVIRGATGSRLSWSLRWIIGWVLW